MVRAVWERYALPLLRVELPVSGDHTDPALPRRGQFLRVQNARLSGVRRADGGLEVRVWNETSEARGARVAARAVPLGPHRIETVRLPSR